MKFVGAGGMSSYNNTVITIYETYSASIVVSISEEVLELEGFYLQFFFFFFLWDYFNALYFPGRKGGYPSSGISATVHLCL